MDKQKLPVIGIVAIIVIIAIVGGWFYYSNMEGSNQNINTSSKSNSERIVAKVNDDIISSIDLQVFVSQLASGQGIDVTTLDQNAIDNLQDQALGGLIANALVRQEAVKSGVTVSEDNIENRLSVVKSQFADDAQYQNALSVQGISEDDLRAQLKIDAIVQTYLEDRFELDEIVATEEEVNAFYQQQFGGVEDAPALEDVEQQIASFIIQQKRQSILNTYVEELKQNASIEVLI